MKGENSSDMLEIKAARAVSEFHMITCGDTLAVGVSGGADSVSLLYFLLRMRQESDISLIAVHVNHNLRGDESKRDEDFVRNLCQNLNVPLVVESVDIASKAKETGTSIEECARNERYRILAGIAGETGKIAVAHTLDDSAETQLFNLARGSGPRGLCGIPPVRDNIIRPLIYCSRWDVEDYCARNSLEYVTDSSNLTNDYSRNKIRHSVIPALAQVNPAYLDNALRAMELLRADADYLDGRAKELYGELSLNGGLDRDKLLALETPLSSRVMMLLLKEAGIMPERSRIGLMLDAVKSGGRLELSASKTLECGGGFVAVKEIAVPVPYFEVKLDMINIQDSKKIEPFTGKIVNLTRMSREKFEDYTKSDANLLKNAFDCDKIGKIVSLRQRLPSDYIRLNGRGCSKTLKKLFNEAKIPPDDRDGVAVMSGGEGGLLWVEGFGVAEDCAVTESTKDVFTITVKNLQEVRPF